MKEEKITDDNWFRQWLWSYTLNEGRLTMEDIQRLQTELDKNPGSDDDI